MSALFRIIQPHSSVVFGSRPVPAIAHNVGISALISCHRFVLFGICRRGRGLAEVFGKIAYLFPDLVFIILGRTGLLRPRAHEGGQRGRSGCLGQYALSLRDAPHRHGLR